MFFQLWMSKTSEFILQVIKRSQVLFVNSNSVNDVWLARDLNKAINGRIDRPKEPTELLDLGGKS